jgi:hypothetical protein
MRCVATAGCPEVKRSISSDRIRRFLVSEKVVDPQRKPGLLPRLCSGEGGKAGFPPGGGSTIGRPAAGETPESVPVRVKKYPGSDWNQG